MKEKNRQDVSFLTVGIDPGKVTGLAICNGGKIESLHTTDFWGAYSMVSNLSKTGKIRFIAVEVPSTKANWHSSGAAHNVGRVCREAELLASGIERLGVAVIRQHPKGKVNSEQFKLITGWRGRTNEHVRDAAMLVFRRCNNE